MTSTAQVQNTPEIKKSPSRSETGHAKNAANFDQLISVTTSFGTAYAPSKTALKLPALINLQTNTHNTITAVNTALSQYSNAVAARDIAFKQLNKLATRIYNSLKATDTTPQVDDNARTIVRKIQGVRASSKTETTQTTTNQISASQMSFDNRLDNLEKLIILLTSIKFYAPNEADLKTTALTTLYNELKTKNTTAINTLSSLTNARITRNAILYTPTTGLVDTALDTKAYIKSIYGATSPQYKQISKLQFKTPKL